MDSSKALKENAIQICQANDITQTDRDRILTSKEQSSEPQSNSLKKNSRAKLRRLRRKKTLERNSNFQTLDEIKQSTNDKELEDSIDDQKVLKGSDDKHYPVTELKITDTSVNKIVAEKMDPKVKIEQKTREEIKAEREAKKLAKQQAKNKKSDADTAASKVEKITKDLKNIIVAEKPKATVDVKPLVQSKDEVDRVQTTDKILVPVIEQEKAEKSKAELRAERRAKQEAQRAAKALNVGSVKANIPKVDVKDIKVTKVKPESAVPGKISKAADEQIIVKKPSSKIVKQRVQHKVKLFNHLYSERESNLISLKTSCVHPAIIQLGEQYRNGVIAGSNARCIAFLNALKIVIRDYETPPQREFRRELESSLKPCIDYLHQSRPVSVSMTNALRFVKRQISQLPMNISDSDAKLKLQEAIDTYYVEQIHTAAKAISGFVQNKIKDGDVILTFGCSSLIQQIFEDAMKTGIDFRVVVVDGRPAFEGREMLRRLVDCGIKCSYILINAVSYIMGEVTKVLLGAHALLANGYVMSRVGTAQIAMVAQSFNVPVLVCCETHKFIERVQTDSFVYNEIGDPDKLVSSTEMGPLCGWIDIPTLSPLNLRYDVTPPELVTAVVTELAILPCTSVPVILRIKPTEIGF